MLWVALSQRHLKIHGLMPQRHQSHRCQTSRPRWRTSNSRGWARARRFTCERLRQMSTPKSKETHAETNRAGFIQIEHRGKYRDVGLDPRFSKEASRCRIEAAWDIGLHH